MALTVVAAPVTAQDAKDAESVARVRELADDARDAFRAGRFADAARLLERAIAIHPDPVLHYNLGRACESAGKRTCARDAYRRYLEVRPDANDRGAVEARIGQLEREIRERQARREGPEPAAAQAPEKTASLPDDGTGTSRSPSIAPWIVAGAGAATVTAGIVVGIMAKGRQASAQDERDVDRAVELQDEAESLATTANVLLVAGAVVGAAGVTWALLDTDDEPGSSGFVGVRVGAGNAALVGAF